MATQKLIDDLGTDELALAVCGLTDDEEDQIEDELWEQFAITRQDFQKIASALIRFTMVQQSALTSRRFHAFVHTDDRGNLTAIAKVEAA